MHHRSDPSNLGWGAKHCCDFIPGWPVLSTTCYRFLFSCSAGGATFSWGKDIKRRQGGKWKGKLNCSEMIDAK